MMPRLTTSWNAQRGLCAATNGETDCDLKPNHLEHGVPHRLRSPSDSRWQAYDDDGNVVGQGGGTRYAIGAKWAQTWDEFLASLLGLTKIEVEQPATHAPEVHAAALLVAEVYAHPWGAVGGPLHVYVDDLNLEDDWFTDPEHRAGIAATAARWYPDAGAACVDLCERTFDALAALTEPQRIEACELAHAGPIPVGFTTEDDQ